LICGVFIGDAAAYEQKRCTVQLGEDELIEEE
jgi:hypothetical protein